MATENPVPNSEKAPKTSGRYPECSDKVLQSSPKVPRPLDQLFKASDRLDRLSKPRTVDELAKVLDRLNAYRRFPVIVDIFFRAGDSLLADSHRLPKMLEEASNRLGN